MSWGYGTPVLHNMQAITWSLSVTCPPAYSARQTGLNVVAAPESIYAQQPLTSSDKQCYMLG